MSGIAGFGSRKAELKALIPRGSSRGTKLGAALIMSAPSTFEAKPTRSKNTASRGRLWGVRPASIPKQDSIVRVRPSGCEAAKTVLRNEGAGHHVRIVVPIRPIRAAVLEKGRSASNGQHPMPTPILAMIGIRLESALTAAPNRELAVASAPPLCAPITVRPKLASGRRLAGLLALPVMVVALVVAVWYFRLIAGQGRRRWRNNIRAVGAERVRGNPDSVGSSAVRHVDRAATSCSGDRFYRGGPCSPAPTHKILQTADPDLSGTARRRFSVMTSRLKPGVYELHLYFARQYSRDPTAREARVPPGLPDFDQRKNRAGKTFRCALRRGRQQHCDERVFKDVSPAPTYVARATPPRWSITLLS